MAQFNVTCRGCKSHFIAKGKSAEFCTTLCRISYYARLKSDEFFKTGTENKNYVICEVCKWAVSSVTGSHLNSYHPEYTTESYKSQFPNSQTKCTSLIKKVAIGGIRGGARIRETGHRERMSNNFKGDLNPMHRSNTTDLQRKQISPYSLEFYKKRDVGLTNDQAQQMADDKNSSFEKTSWTQQKYWIDKGLSEQESINKISELQKTFSLDICIHKYGEVEGRKRWQERQDKWKAKVFNANQHIGGGLSKVSNDLFSSLESFVTTKKLSFKTGKNEKFIRDTKFDRVYKYDFCIPELRLMIEFHGDYWHCNPNKWTGTQTNKVKSLTAQEIWEYDKRKKECAESYGYTLMFIWETDYYVNSQAEIDKCIAFINEQHEKILKEINT